MLKKSWLLMTARRDLYRAKLSFHLFLLSLSVLFVAGMIAYLLIRNHSLRPGSPTPYRILEIPIYFWISTGLLFVVSIALHLAVNAIHRNRLQPFHRLLVLANVAALAFTGMQAFGLRQLLNVHLSSANGSTISYAMCFFMAFVHALHVIGGLVFLGFVIAQANQQRYDHERHWTVDNCASYWHFLDAVWVIMLLTFYIAR